eukprot:6192442-Pleurochrysis_carterae.AAC.1
MMNWARIQMKNWIDTKNEHEARVQKRWENRGITKEVFQKWKALTRLEPMDNDRGKEHKEDKGDNDERTYGINHWGRAHILVRGGHYLTLPYCKRCGSLLYLLASCEFQNFDPEFRSKWYEYTYVTYVLVGCCSGVVVIASLLNTLFPESITTTYV